MHRYVLCKEDVTNSRGQNQTRSHKPTSSYGSAARETRPAETREPPAQTALPLLKRNPRHGTKISSDSCAPRPVNRPLANAAASTLQHVSTLNFSLVMSLPAEEPRAIGNRLVIYLLVNISLPLAPATTWTYKKALLSASEETRCPKPHC